MATGIVLRAWALAAAVAAAPQAASAHPHVWTTVETEIAYDRNMVAGFRHKWTFDEFYSAFAGQGLDADGDGTLDREELQALADENVESLQEFDYFTFVTVDREPAALGAPRDHYLEQAGDRLVLHFFLPLETPVDARLGEVSFSVYDPTYYVAFSFAEEEPVRLASSAPAPCRPRLSDPEPSPAETTLGEAFYESLGADSDYGASFSPSVSIECRAR